MHKGQEIHIGPFHRSSPGLAFLDGLEMPRCPPGGDGGSGRGEEHLDLPAQAVAPETRTPENKMKRIMEEDDTPLLRFILQKFTSVLCTFDVLP